MGKIGIKPVTLREMTGGRKHRPSRHREWDNRFSLATFVVPKEKLVQLLQEKKERVTSLLTKTGDVSEQTRLDAIDELERFASAEGLSRADVEKMLYEEEFAARQELLELISFLEITQRWISSYGTPEIELTLDDVRFLESEAPLVESLSPLMAAC